MISGVSSMSGMTISKETGMEISTEQEKAEETQKKKADSWAETLKKIQEKQESSIGDEKPDIDNSKVAQKISTGKKAPYSYLAKDGIIEYNGVAFVCDDANQALCLGDMSNPDNVLTIPLEKGGCLKVNRDNIGQLSSAISMFSPADIKRILTAIAQDKQCAKKINEIEDLESGEGMRLDEKS